MVTRTHGCPIHDGLVRERIVLVEDAKASCGSTADDLVQRGVGDGVLEVSSKNVDDWYHLMEERDIALTYAVRGDLEGLEDMSVLMGKIS